MKRGYKIALGIGGAILALAGVGFGLYSFNENHMRIDSLPDDKLNDLREEVRQEWCKSGKNPLESKKLKALLDTIDIIITSRKPKLQGDYVYPPHTEHGWYLSEDN